MFVVLSAAIWAVLSDASLKCWGWCYKGQLGLGDTDYHGDGPNEMGDNLPAVNLGAGKAVVAVDLSSALGNGAG